MFEMVIANILGIFILIFLFWLRLKDDYHYEKIFNLVSFVLAGILIGFISLKFLPSVYLFWVYLIAIIASFTVGIIKLKIRFFESLDSLVISLLPYFGLYLLSQSIKNYSLSSFIGFWIVTVFVFLYFFVDANYRKFTWYKSGRVGFSGLLVAGLFFVVRSVLSVFFVDGPTIMGQLDIYISASFSFVSFLLLFNLAKKVS